jgi:hypothetical protein
VLGSAAVRRLPLVATVLLLAACASGEVRLSYGSEPGRRLEYTLGLTADIDRTLADEVREQRVEATFRVTQEVLETLPTGGTQERMTLVPESLALDGDAVDVGPPQEFDMELAEDGRIVTIERSGAAQTDALAPLGIERLLPRLRPVLPGVVVAPGESWRSDTSITDGSGTFSLESSSRLARLGTVGGRDAAFVRTTYVSPVDRRERFANAVTDLRGRDVGAQEAWFALEGFLLRATGDSVGSYDVTFRPPENETGLQPVEGSLVVELHTVMELIASG